MKKQDLANAFDLLEPSQEAKYSVKNTINANSERRKPFFKRFKRPALAMTCFALAAILVVSAAAIGISLFNAVYGEKAETLTPYGITIGTSAQNKDVILTLHESVADDYATAYIFSIKGLTDAGKALVVSNTLDPNANKTTFEQMNITRESPPEITNSKIFNVTNKTISGESTNLSIGLRYNNVAYNAAINAVNVIAPIASLSEENCQYYVLYIITPEKYQLTLTFDGLELPLPEATTHIPGIEVELGDYIQEYYFTDARNTKVISECPISAVLTPLGLYVNDKNAGSTPLMYRNATLTFKDGSEKALSEIANDKAGVVKWKASYFPTFYQGTVYLFNEIMDVSTVKSLLFYDDIEFPFDGSAPIVRSTGRTLEPNDPKILLWKIANGIRNYFVETCPDKQTVIDPYTKEPIQVTGWEEVKCINDSTLCICGTVYDRKYDYHISFSKPTGRTLEEDVRAETNGESFSVLATGTYKNAEYLAIDNSGPGYTGSDRRIYALYEGMLWRIENCGDYGQPGDYVFDALLKLITSDK